MAMNELPRGENRPADRPPSPVLLRLRRMVKAGVDWFVGNDLVTGFLFVATVALLIYSQARPVSFGELVAGEFAFHDYVVPFDVEVVDEENRELQRREAGELSPPVYLFDPSVQKDRLRKLRRFFEAGRSFLSRRPAEQQEAPLSPEEREALWEELPLSVEKRTLGLFLRYRFSEDLEGALRHSYQGIIKERVAVSPPILERAKYVLVLHPDGGEQQLDPDKVLSIEMAKAQLQAAVKQKMEGMGGGDSLASAFLAPLVETNLSLDQEETARRFEAAVTGVPDRQIMLPRGMVIARQGERLTEEDVAWLQKIETNRTGARAYRTAAGSAVLLFFMVFFLWRYIRVHQREFSDRHSLFGMNMIVGLGTVLLAFALLHLGDLLADNISLGGFHRIQPYRYAIPMAVGALLMVLLTNARMAMFFSILASVSFGFLVAWDLPLTVYALFGSFAGIYGLTQYKERSVIIKAGLVVGCANAVIILALAAAEGTVVRVSSLLFDMAAGLVSGILVAFVASFSLPLLEWIFNVVTDIRLLELSNLNSPLLRKLAVQAPGTYNHSVIVGTLAEAAAESIGGGALLCRVAAYYHDIGKMNKPEYFIENSPQDAIKRHEKLSPTMSSLIILSHVKDGAKLARDYHLPRPIEDFILQHHGTRLITYFFKKAKKMEDRGIQEVSESNFRYPGPKPQSKEAAIFMMADSVEAAARTVEGPTPAKFKDLIRQIVNAVILDDQLSETELTFSDLDRIQRSFEVTLASIYHHRIEYPGFRFEDRPGRERAVLPA